MGAIIAKVHELVTMPTENGADAVYRPIVMAFKKNDRPQPL